MEAVAEIVKQPTTDKKGMVINRPTSPDQIHDEASATISKILQVAGQVATPEGVKVDQTFKQTTQLKEIGAEPSGGEISPKDALRIITEELAGDSEGAHRVVAGKGLDAIRLRAGRLGKIGNFLERLHLKKAA